MHLSVYQVLKPLSSKATYTSLCHFTPSRAFPRYWWRSRRLPTKSTYCVCCMNPRVYVSVQDYKNQFDSRDSRVKVASYSTGKQETRGEKSYWERWVGSVQICVATIVSNRPIQMRERVKKLAPALVPTINRAPTNLKNRHWSLQMAQKFKTLFC